MAVKTFEILICDRCGYEQKIDDPKKKDDWLILIAQMLSNGRPVIGATDGSREHLCPDCADELALWFNQNRTPGEIGD